MRKVGMVVYLQDGCHQFLLSVYKQMENSSIICILWGKES